MNTPETLFDVLAGAADRYGDESVTQLEHALQCAAIAEREDGRPAVIAAALLHDVGHLIHKFEKSIFKRGFDDRHEVIGAGLLERWFGTEVTAPVRLHVPAKRYLCATQADYWGGLSAASKRSLEVQGNAFGPEDVAAFTKLPYAKDAVLLRRWDDRAKIPDLAVPGLDHYRKVVAALTLPVVHVAIAEV